MIARYDLSKRNISFDFYAWQTHAVLLGATEIVFRIDNGYGKHAEPDDVLARRYRSIVKPGPALLGLPSREGVDGEECATHRLTGILGTKNWDFPRLRSVKPAGTAEFTVTLRNCPVHPHRNSDQRVWRRFAAEIGAVVIEDWHDRPIDLLDRVALYAGARMNFGVVNGPMGLLMLSPYPMQMWGCGLAEQAWRKHGIERDQQVPWLRPGQSLVWETPTLDGMRRAMERL